MRSLQLPPIDAITHTGGQCLRTIDPLAGRGTLELKASHASFHIQARDRQVRVDIRQGAFIAVVQATMKARHSHRPSGGGLPRQAPAHRRLVHARTLLHASITNALRGTESIAIEAGAQVGLPTQVLSDRTVRSDTIGEPCRRDHSRVEQGALDTIEGLGLVALVDDAQRLQVAPRAHTPCLAVGEVEVELLELQFTIAVLATGLLEVAMLELGLGVQLDPVGEVIPEVEDEAMDVELLFAAAFFLVEVHFRVATE